MAMISRETVPLERPDDRVLEQTYREAVAQLERLFRSRSRVSLR